MSPARRWLRDYRGWLGYGAFVVLFLGLAACAAVCT